MRLVLHCGESVPVKQFIYLLGPNSYLYCIAITLLRGCCTYGVVDDVYTAHMRSKGYGTWFVCKSFCLLSVCPWIFQHYRPWGGLWATPAASEQRDLEKEKGDFP